ncbi:MAG: Asp/Glu racemase [Aestuariivirgaceae bacterium]|jgi:maleate isomerase
MDTASDRWERLSPEFDQGVGERASIGLLALATDRIGTLDTEAFLSAPGVTMFSTRIQMAAVATPESLAKLGEHLEQGTRLLVPGSRLDVIGFSCTSGTVAVGVAAVREAIWQVRPGIAVATPIEAGAKGLKRVGARRISLLVPYLPRTADLVAGFFEEEGLVITRRATFDLGGDPEMNRLSPAVLAKAARAVDDPASEAVFISCTGLRTAPVVAALEKELGKPVVTSNQALAWDALRLAGVSDSLPGRGRLFTLA